MILLKEVKDTNKILTTEQIFEVVLDSLYINFYDKSKYNFTFILEIFSSIAETKKYLNSLKKQGKTIGFVPTMGALHRGHTSLLDRAKRENDIAVASIFVNPLQFNDKKDLEKYPRTFESDTEKLKSVHCDVLFAPSTEEMYPSLESNSDSPIPPFPDSAKETEKRRKGEKMIVPLGHLDLIMEGTHRPGHFQGMCVVVKKLFDIIEPTKAYFGEKDFQQLAIIRHMVKVLNIPVEIIPCPTVREADGLAMSSRNALLNTDERKNAAHIYKTLSETKEKLKNTSVADLKVWVKEQINANPFLELEYFEIVNAETLQPVTNRSTPAALRACIAVRAGNVRLIDNISI